MQYTVIILFSTAIDSSALVNTSLIPQPIIQISWFLHSIWYYPFNVIEPTICLNALELHSESSDHFLNNIAFPTADSGKHEPLL